MEGEYHEHSKAFSVHKLALASQINRTNIEIPYIRRNVIGLRRVA